MHYPTYEQLTTAHKAAGGIWDTTKVFTMRQLQDKLADVQDSANTKEIDSRGQHVLAFRSSHKESQTLPFQVAAANAALKAEAKAGLKPVYPDAQERKGSFGQCQGRCC